MAPRFTTLINVIFNGSTNIRRKETNGMSYQSAETIAITTRFVGKGILERLISGSTIELIIDLLDQFKFDPFLKVYVDYSALCPICRWYQGCVYVGHSHFTSDRLCSYYAEGLLSKSQSPYVIDQDTLKLFYFGCREHIAQVCNSIQCISVMRKNLKIE